MKCLLLLSALLLQEATPAPPQEAEPVVASTSDEKTKGDPNQNALQFETSPYLLQHADNPVDWMPWGEEAFAKAKAEDKPIFLSSGYSACHWCHVMEHESFEDERIAALINEYFVPVKLDREERPDVDAIYMAVVQQMTGSGGWPLSVWMTPDLEPFYGGTYFPPKAMSGRYSFEDVINGVHQMWTETRDKAVTSGRGFVEGLNGQQAPKEAVDASIDEILAKFDELATRRYDPEWAGFAQEPNYAPKFPRAGETMLLLRRGRRTEQPKLEEMALETLDAMVEGGMYDQVGGGFARYSVDRAWLVPHFEKMLYDNAQLAEAYLEGWQATRNTKYERIARETLDYLIKEMRSPEGGFYSATDADSAAPDGHMVEGYFFVWTEEEFEAVTGEDAAIAKAWYGVKAKGNFHEVPGGNVLTARRDVTSVAKELGVSALDVRLGVASARKKLYDARAKRTPPRLDDKVLSSWNGLALSAFSRAAAILEDPRYLDVARQNAEFLLTKMRTEDGGLHRTRRSGVSTLGGFLQDHAFVVQGLLALFEADQDPEKKSQWLKAAQELHAHTEAEFAAEDGGYLPVAKSRADKLPIQLRTAQEGSLPSEVVTAGMNAYRLGLLAGDRELIERSRSVLKRHDADISNWPNAHSKAALLLELLVSDPREIYVVGPRNHPHVVEYLGSLQKEWPPHSVFVHSSGADDPVNALLPALKGKTMRDDEPTIYICRDGVCDLPHTLTEILGPLPKKD